jgi:uncharacterized protein (TIGR02598 family)
MTLSGRGASRFGFSLVEVVIALGVIAFAIIAILGVFPLGLSTSHSSQDETRSSAIAENIFSALTSQAQVQFSSAALPVSSPYPGPTLDLTNSNKPVTAPAAFLYADNNGQISQSATGATYSISIGTNNTSPSFYTGFANTVTIRVVTPPLPSQSATPTANQTTRDFVRVISKY